MLGRALLLALLGAAPAAAQGDPPSIAFSWTRGEGAEGCPDQEMIADAVAARLGYAPFAADSERRLEASVVASEDSPGLTGELRLYDEAGALVGERTLQSESDECFELARALELAIAIAIDPAAVTRPPPEPLPGEIGPPPPPEMTEPPPPEAPQQGDPDDETDGGASTGEVDVRPAAVIRVPNTDADRTPTVPEPLEGDPDFIGPPRPPAEPPGATGPDGEAATSRDPILLDGTPWQLSFWSGPTWSSGTTPGPSFGATLTGLGLRYRLVSGMLELRHDLPQSAPADDGRSAAVGWLTTATGHACVHAGWMYGCGSGAAGLLQAGAIGLARPRLVALPYLALGARAGADLPVLSWAHRFFELWRLRLHADVYAPVPFFRWRLKHDQPPNGVIWELPVVAVVLGAAIVFALPP